MKMQVTASTLQRGDILLGSKEVVENVSSGIRTPSGKVEVSLKYIDNDKRGYCRTGVWNRHTKINVDRS